MLRKLLALGRIDLFAMGAMDSATHNDQPSLFADLLALN